MSFSISNSEVVQVSRRRASEPRLFLASAALTALIIFVALWTLTSNFRQGFLAPEYGMWVAKREWVQNCRFEPTVVLGDSRMVAGVVPAELGDATNLALGGATPIEEYYTLLHASPCARPPQRVVISFSPQQLMETAYFWPRTALFGYLTYQELDQIRSEARSLGDDTLYGTANIGDFDAKLTNWLYAYHFPSYYMSSIFNGQVVGRLGAYHHIQQEVADTAGHHLYGRSNGVHEASEEAGLERFKVLPLVDAYFVKLLTLCQQKGISVYYIAAPWNQTTYAHLRPGFTDQLSQYLEGLAGRFSNFHLLAPVEHMEDADFGDPAHLNANGAAKFSALIAAELRAPP